MNGKKWIGIFLSALLAIVILWMGLNIVVDPFGVFGDTFFNWYDYNETLNPKTAKVTYLSKHFEEYDSYIIGSSAAASYMPETLNEYTDARFYNCFHHKADIDYDRALIAYLIEHDDVENIFLILGPSEANYASPPSKAPTNRAHCKIDGSSPLSFYCGYLFANPRYALEKISSFQKDTELPQAFDAILAETGCYDRRIDEVESIGDLQSYLDKTGDKFPALAAGGELKNIENCAENVAEIKKMCDRAGVKLTIILSPINEQQLQAFSEDSINEYFEALSSAADYWNFSFSPISRDARFFYDQTHIRNDTADMVLARIFGDKSKYLPQNFGVYCDKNSTVTIQQLHADKQIDTFAHIPILLFHHFDKTGDGSSILSYGKFEQTLSLLKKNGYNTVTFDDLISYVETGKALPKKAVVLTLDDGYSSNYDFVYPALKKYGYSASIFVIGSSVGLDTYKGNAEKPIIPHFNKEQMIEMIDSGHIDVYSHTFDMHQSAAHEETTPVRESIIPFEKESESDYINALNADIQKQHQLYEEMGLPAPNVLAFPRGYHQTISNVILAENNYDVTVTIDETRTNTLVCGLHQSLNNLGRFNIAEYTTDLQILDYLNK